MNYIEITSNNFNTQTWCKSNLNTDRFLNGDLILEVRTQHEKEQALKNGTPAWCFNPKDSLGNEKLYNLHALFDNRGLLPEGMRLPEKSDLKILKVHLENDTQQFEKFNFDLKLTEYSFWSSSKFSFNENFVFGISNQDCYLITSKDDYRSVRGVISENRYLLSLDRLLSAEETNQVAQMIILGDYHFQAQNFEEAIVNYENALILLPNNAELHFKIGKSYLELNDKCKSKNSFENAVFLSPEQSDYHYYLGISMVNEIYGVSYAEPFFDQAILLNNKKEEYYKARAEERSKRYDKEGYILDIEKANLDFIPTKYYEYRALIKARNGEHLDAIAMYDLLIERSVYKAGLFYTRGKYKLSLDVSSALIDFEMAISLDESFLTNIVFLGDYGYTLYRGNLFKKALDILNISIGLQNEEEGYYTDQIYYRSLCLFELGMYSDSLRDIDEIINDQLWYNPEYLVLRGRIYLKLNRTNEALKDLKLLLEKINKTNTKSHLAGYHFLFGEYYYSISEYKSAFENYTKSVELGESKEYKQILEYKLKDSSIKVSNAEKMNRESNESMKAMKSKTYDYSYPNYNIHKNEYLKTYRALLSERDFEKVIVKVQNSDSLKNFINKSLNERLIPSDDVFVKQITNCRSFMFVFNYNKIDLACIALFDIWVNEVNKKYSFYDDNSLTFVLRNILVYSNKLATGRLNN